MIDADVHCVICGYNLRMLQAGGTCPECGAAIDDTLTFGLAHLDAERLRRALRGTRMLLNVCWASVLAVLAFMAFVPSAPRLLALVGLGSWMLMWYGGVELGTIRLPSDDREPVAQDWALRYLPIITALMLFLHLLDFGPHTKPLVLAARLIAGTEAALVWMAVLHSRIARMGEQSRDLRIQERASLAMVVCCGVAALIVVVAFTTVMLKRSNAPLALSLFLLLGLVLLLLFHVSSLAMLRKVVLVSQRIRKAIDASAPSSADSDTPGQVTEVSS